jgi:glycosyltransferase involved in cell wall biosynthesis
MFLLLREKRVRMRILYIHNQYAATSGEEHAAEAIAGLLKRHGHEVFWFRRSSENIGRSYVNQARALFSGIHNPRAARALARELDEIRPDLVQVQNIYPWLSPSIFRPIRERRIPVVMRCPNYRLFCPNGLHLVRGKVCERCLGPGREAWCVLKNCEGMFFKSAGYALRNAWARISGRILRNVDMFIVQTEFQKGKFVERGIPESRIGIVPGFVPNNNDAEPQELGDLVTFVGRVSSEKGIEDFLAAARLLPDVPFAVAGNEDSMSGIREKPPGNVRWLGFLQADGLRQLYRTSRIIVVPSRWYEGFPNVAVQAMAHRRPILASRIGALTSIVEGGRSGLLFEPSDPEDLATKIRLLYDDEDRCRRLGECGYAKAKEEYSPASIYEKLMAIYEMARVNSLMRGTHAAGVNDVIQFP